MRLVVIAGPANSGKMPLARKLMQDDETLALVHRDDLRTVLGTQIDEWHITLLMAALTRSLLSFGRDVVVCAWNMDISDWHLWQGIATEFSAKMEWLDVRKPEVAALIPPLAT